MAQLSVRGGAHNGALHVTLAVAGDVRSQEELAADKLEYMFEDAGLIKGVDFLNKAAAMNPLRWHGGTARALVVQLRGITGADARRPIKLRRQDTGDQTFSMPSERDAGRKELTPGAIELSFATPVAAAQWIQERGQKNVPAALDIGGGMAVDPTKCGKKGLTGRAGIDAGEVARLQALYAEPEPEPDRKAVDAAEGSIRATLKEHDETNENGLVGPSKHGTLLKVSRTGGSKLLRFFVLDARRLYYFDAEADAGPMLASPQDQRFDLERSTDCHHKGWQDLVGCTVAALPDEAVSDMMNVDTLYGLSIEEEFKHPESPQEAWRLFSVYKDERDEWIQTIQLASRPTWLGVDQKGTGMPTAEPVEPDSRGSVVPAAQEDPRYKKCLVCTKSFGINCRQSHCRRCGGVMCYKKVGKQLCMTLVDLPGLCYETPQKVCTKCAHEKAPASRHILKVPKTQRASAAKEKKSVAAAAGAKKLKGKLFGGSKGK